MLLAALTLALPIAAGAPAVAGPCASGPPIDPCVDLAYVASLELVGAAEVIPADGVIVLRGVFGGLSDAELFASVELTVTRDGQPVAGALERTEAEQVLVWRPDAAWVPGPHAVRAAVHNDLPVEPACGEAMFTAEFAVLVDVAPGVPISPPTLTGSARLQSTKLVALEHLACCEDAAPVKQTAPCNSTYLEWDDGACFAVDSRGYLELDLELAPAVSGPTAGQLLYRYVTDGAPGSADLALYPGTFAGAPVCLAVEALDMASGAVARGPEQCFGAEFAAELGLQPAPLPDSYHCPLQRCEVQGNTWDLERCTPLAVPVEDADAASTDGGCGCRGGTAGAPGLVVLLALRRRRSRAHGAGSSAPPR